MAVVLICIRAVGLCQSLWGLKIFRGFYHRGVTSKALYGIRALLFHLSNIFWVRSRRILICVIHQWARVCGKFGSRYVHRSVNLGTFYCDFFYTFALIKYEVIVYSSDDIKLHSRVWILRLAQNFRTCCAVILQFC